MFKNLFCRTEYSYRSTFGQTSKVLTAGGVGIADRAGTWGHVDFFNAAKKANVKPVLGVELPVMDTSHETKVPVYFYRFLARNDVGLREIYRITTKSTEDDKGRLSRLGLHEIDWANLIVIAPDTDWRKAPPKAYVAVTPGAQEYNVKQAMERGLKPLAGSNNYYPRPEHYGAYEIISPRFKENVAEGFHILTEEELRVYVPWCPEAAIKETGKLYDQCNVTLPKAEMVKFESKKTLRQLCIEGAKVRKVDLKNRVYGDRLHNELTLISDKKFEDYFFVLADMIAWAKQHMVVGPARGSSCGSLTCYLLGITDIDPIHYGLLFERFIDVSRADLPDIDVDFQDDRRELVFDYIKEKYGSNRIARIGTISRYKSDSAINDVAKELKVPIKETEALKAAMLKRSSGDARAMLCIMDTFTDNTMGREFIKKYPAMKVAGEIENHANHTGQHAAGIIITQHPVNHYCSVDLRTGVAQVDWRDAAKINLLKIDALGLRTLSVIQDTLEHVGKDIHWLQSYPLDDKKAFDVINKRRMTGIFQFEGRAVEGLCRQMKVENIEDIIALTALARPGPLVSGSAGDFVNVRTGKKAVKYLHPMAEPITKVTFGTVIYQEQVMKIAKDIGNLTWEEVNALRKAMGKSLGKEYFDGYYGKFWEGAKKNGLTEKESQHVWDHMCTMGSYGFNRSHAVAYGNVSYWCCVLKSKFPLEYAAAQLRNSKGDDSTILTLRELVKEGFKYIPVDAEKSEINWAVKNGVLYGGLTNIRGVGGNAAQKIIDWRNKKLTEINIVKKVGKKKVKEVAMRQYQLPAGLAKKLENPVTPFDNIFEAETLFAEYYEDPEKFGIRGHVWKILEVIDQEPDQNIVFLGKLKTKNVRDANETISVQKRNGKVLTGPTLALNFRVADDSGIVMCRIKKGQPYEEMALPIVEHGVIDEDWYLVRGQYAPTYGMVFVEKVRKLEVNTALLESKNGEQEDQEKEPEAQKPKKSEKRVAAR